jgi:threonine synthase
MNEFVTHLECAPCAERFEASLVHGLCTKCQRPLWVKYDLEAVGKVLGKA